MKQLVVSFAVMLVASAANAQDVCPEFANAVNVTRAKALPKSECAFSLAGANTGSTGDVQGTNAGWGASVEGQVWFGFAIK